MKIRWQANSGFCDQVQPFPSSSELINILKENYPPTATSGFNSLGKAVANRSIYNGSGGNWFLYERFHSLTGQFSNELKISLQSHMAKISPIQPDDPPSFIMGKVGLHAINAVVNHNTDSVQQIIAKSATLEQAECELLYGTAGYIYTLIYLLKKWPDCPQRELILETLSRSVQINIGQTRHQDRLRTVWHDKAYFGGAHGLFGNLQVLLMAREFIGSQYDSVIQNSLSFLCGIQYADGNWTSSEGRKSADLVQFCHGAPGAVAPLCGAFEAFGTEAYLDAAILAGDCIWEKGLWLKGPGLCHGISGNAYAFLTLYRVTKNELWLARARDFAYKMYRDDQLVTTIGHYQFSGRKATGTWDYPYSLLIGEAGSAWFLLDLEVNPLNAKFPCYEI